MNSEQFTVFLTTPLAHAAAYAVQGAIVFVCMDWRHMAEVLSAGTANKLELHNLCVWVKSNGGMGSLYRSRHELVFVFRNGAAGHRNNVQLGRYGRNRNNTWHYPGTNTFGGKHGSGRKLHPTVKPIAMVADALLDVTKRDDIVLDPFLGSGTTILAAERTGRRGFAIELDPLYVDTAILRWQRLTRRQARLPCGRNFDEVRKVKERGMKFSSDNAGPEDEDAKLARKTLRRRREEATTDTLDRCNTKERPCAIISDCRPRANRFFPT